MIKKSKSKNEIIVPITFDGQVINDGDLHLNLEPSTLISDLAKSKKLKCPKCGHISWESHFWEVKEL